MTVTAVVSQIDYEKGYVKVVLTDRDNIETDWLPMLSFEYEMPKINDIVTCDFTDSTCQEGFCKGRYFSDKRKPIKTGKDTYHKLLLEDADIEYNRNKKELIITVENIKLLTQNVRIKGKTQIKGDVIIEGDVQIKGDLVVDGNIHSNGNITATGTIVAKVAAQAVEGVDIK